MYSIVCTVDNTVWHTWKLLRVNITIKLEKCIIYNSMYYVLYYIDYIYFVTGAPRFLIVLHRYRVLHKLDICGNPASSNSTGVVFPKAFAHFMSLCHILVIRSVFQTLSLLLYLRRWSEISDRWCYSCKKIMTCWRLTWWLVFFINKVFLN